jgi:hypothetical protein
MPLPADMAAQSPFKDDLFLEDGRLKPREDYSWQHRLALVKQRSFSVRHVHEGRTWPRK